MKANPCSAYQDIRKRKKSCHFFQVSLACSSSQIFGSVCRTAKPFLPHLQFLLPNYKCQEEQCFQKFVVHISLDFKICWHLAWRVQKRANTQSDPFPFDANKATNPSILHRFSTPGRSFHVYCCFFFFFLVLFGGLWPNMFLGWLGGHFRHYSRFQSQNIRTPQRKTCALLDNATQTTQNAPGVKRPLETNALHVACTSLYPYILSHRVQALQLTVLQCHILHFSLLNGTQLRGKPKNYKCTFSQAKFCSFFAQP